MVYSSQKNKLYFNNRSLIPSSLHVVEDDIQEIGTTNQVLL